MKTSASVPNVTRCELDSHADTCVAGSNCVLFEEPTRHVSVQAYSDEYKPLKDIPVATVATVWMCPETGERYLLLIHEALFFGERMKHSLICPNQLRAHGATVEDVPRQFDKKSRHAIRLPNDPPTTIPLVLRGIISYFETTKPTSSDLDDLPRLELTSPLPWDPYSPQFEEVEETFEKTAWDSAHAPKGTGPSVIASVQSADENTLWNETRCVSAVFASLETHDCVEHTSEE